MGRQEPFTGAALSKELVLHNLFTNTLIYVEELEVASLSSRNSAVFKGQGWSRLSRLWVGWVFNDLKINHLCLVKKRPLSWGICSPKALKLNSQVMAWGCSFQAWEPVVLACLLGVFLPPEGTQTSCSKSYCDGFALVVKWGGKTGLEISRRVRPAHGDREGRAVAMGLWKDILKITL